MKIYKFGGASVKSATDIKNLKHIISKEKGNLVVVISAMGKTTNLLEQICGAYMDESKELHSLIKDFKQYHYQAANELLDDKGIQAIDQIFRTFEEKINTAPTNQFNYEYDQIIHFGELLSTTIVFHYLKNSSTQKYQWLDARKFILTDDHYREARVLWEHSVPAIQATITKNDTIYITQGFIGSAKDKNRSVTLGREGSDYTGAILAYALEADCFTVWKDVDGVYNADPAYFRNAIRLDEISYQEAVELTYYGAKVIHPKTIKPLQNKKIPMIVRSFIYPDREGTVIKSFDELNLGIRPEVPVYIFEKNQMLISISTRDFAFVAESNLSEIYDLLAQYRIKVNLTQNSAISFSISVNDEASKVQPFIYCIHEKYKVRYNSNMQLITIRHYNEDVISKIVGNTDIFIEQRTRNTARFIVEM